MPTSFVECGPTICAPMVGLPSIARDSRLLELLVEFAELLELPFVRPPRSCAFMKRAYFRERPRRLRRISTPVDSASRA